MLNNAPVSKHKNTFLRKQNGIVGAVGVRLCKALPFPLEQRPGHLLLFTYKFVAESSANPVNKPMALTGSTR